MLRKHGGNYLDTKTPPVPAPRSISQKIIETNGIAPDLSQIESSLDGEERMIKEPISSQLDKSLKQQAKELKRIV